MSEHDAETFGLPTDRQSRARYIRLDDATHNYADIGDAKWYEKMVYVLDNGEDVPAAIPWRPPDLWAAITTTLANRILDEIDAGLDGGKRRYSAAAQATDRAAWKVVTRHVAMTQAQARAVIRTWVKNGVLVRGEYTDPSNRRTCQEVRVNAAKRPG